ncbi:MAG: esterase [Sphingomonas sp.]|nr:esterase [Sphingomonas sp.]
MKSLRCCIAALSILAGGAALPASAQVDTKAPPRVAGAKTIPVETITVHSTAIEGNLEGESPDRNVIVVLPYGYASHPDRRYPVVYALHGYSIGAEQWTREIHVPETIENAFAAGVRDMIVVFPDSKTIYGGSMYSSSATTGDFERFISHDLIAYIDAHYRTIADRRSRGLVGHSMGGYGATRIAMRHPDVFGAVYMMSPCCLSPRSVNNAPDADTMAKVAAVKNPGDAENLPFFAKAMLATAAAWSPDPKKAPLYLDLPVKDGKADEAVLAKWTANAPLAFADQYIGNMRRYKAIAIDVGDQDGLKADAEKLHDLWTRYGIVNSFEIYPGTHTSDVAIRFQEKVMPFFNRNLEF